MHDDGSLDRLLALLQRELGAAEVTLARGPEPLPGPEVVTHTLPHGRVVHVRFDAPPADPDAVRAQLASLAEGFDGILDLRPSQPPRAPVDPMEVLAEVATHLRALAAEADARDVAVIDALSPIVWACASGAFDLAEEPEEPVAKVIPLRPSQPAPSEEPANEDDAMAAARRQLSDVIARVRAMPELAHVRRGAPLHAVLRGDDGDVVVQSFASTWMVVVLCAPPVDEVRVQRTLHHGLSVIERLLVAMPPLEPDPEPVAGVVRLRRLRR